MKFWTYTELTEQTEKTITENVNEAKALPEGDTGRDQLMDWAFGAWGLWYDLVARCEEFRIADSTRLRELMELDP